MALPTIQMVALFDQTEALYDGVSYPVYIDPTTTIKVVDVPFNAVSELQDSGFFIFNAGYFNILQTLVTDTSTNTSDIATLGGDVSTIQTQIEYTNYGSGSGFAPDYPITISGPGSWNYKNTTGQTLWLILVDSSISSTPYTVVQFSKDDGLSTFASLNPISPGATRATSAIPVPPNTSIRVEWSTVLPPNGAILPTYY